MTNQKSFPAASERQLTGGNRWMRIADVMRETAMPRSTIYAKAKAGDFPKPVRLTPRISAWEASAVRAWVEARIKESAENRSEAA